MSLSRTALRLLTVEALKGATLAQERVYDSRVGDLNASNWPDDGKVTLIVNTDEDVGEPVNPSFGAPPFRRNIELMIEIGVVKRTKVGTTYEIGIPDTDARLEATLDFAEHQVMRRLGYEHSALVVAAQNNICTLWRDLITPVKYECHRQIDEESGVRLAIRVLVLTCQISDAQMRGYNPDEEAVPTGIDALPDPLKKVAEIVPVGSSAADVIAQIVANNSAIQLTPLEDIDMQIDANTEEDGGEVDVDVEIQSSYSIYNNVTTGASLEIDYARGTSQILTLGHNLTSITFKNWPRAGKTGRLILYVKQTGSFTIANNAWQPLSVWAGGLDYVPSVGANKEDQIVLSTGDGGAKLYGNVVGKDYT